MITVAGTFGSSSSIIAIDPLMRIQLRTPRRPLILRWVDQLKEPHHRVAAYPQLSAIFALAQPSRWKSR